MDLRNRTGRTPDRPAPTLAAPSTLRRPLDGIASPAQEEFLRGIQRKAEFVELGHPAGLEAAESGLAPTSLLFVGMGGSGAAAMLVRDAAQRVLDVPTSLLQHDEVPKWVDGSVHVVAVSYSGDTEETLSVVRQVQALGCRVVAFASGGRLPGLVGRHVAQPQGYAPRVALAHVWSSILGYLEGSGLLRESVPVERAAAAVREADAAYGPHVPEQDNVAKRLARSLQQRIPHVYVSPSFSGVGRLFTALLNENAKRIAHVDDVPESNHNALTGWGGDPQRHHFSAIALSHDAERTELRRRLEFMAQRHRAWRVPWHEQCAPPIRSFADHVVEQARMLQFLDYVSYYAAVARNVDPAEIKEVRGLKEYLRSGAGRTGAGRSGEGSGGEANGGEGTGRWRPPARPAPGADGSVSSVR